MPGTSNRALALSATLTFPVRTTVDAPLAPVTTQSIVLRDGPPDSWSAISSVPVPASFPVGLPEDEHPITAGKAQSVVSNNAL
jgi:hypothetical protein